jgi:hypothetical protein
MLHSGFVQRISLTRHSPCLDFTTTIDWQDQHFTYNLYPRARGTRTGGKGLL